MQELGNPPTLNLDVFDTSGPPHTADKAHPYLKHDLKEAKVVSVEVWIEALFALSPDSLVLWLREIRELGVFQDELIQQSLSEYSTALREEARFAPFVTCCNRIVEMARGKLTALADTDAADPIVFANCSKKPVQIIEQHGTRLGEVIKPDVVALRRSKALEIPRAQGVLRWVDILMAIELKYKDRIARMLHEERLRRGVEPNGKDDDLSPVSICSQMFSLATRILTYLIASSMQMTLRIRSMPQISIP